MSKSVRRLLRRPAGRAALGVLLVGVVVLGKAVPVLHAVLYVAALVPLAYQGRAIRHELAGYRPRRRGWLVTNHATALDTASAVHHTGTDDSSWNGPAAVAAMPNEAGTLRYCHAWRESGGEADAKATYKFPHHRKDGGPANLAACRNGLARLSSADIPVADEAGVRAHLQAHLDDADSAEDRAPTGWRALVTMFTKTRERKPRDWFRISNVDKDRAEVYIYDEIGFWGTSAADFCAQLAEVKAKAIDLHINSPGGEVFDGVTIYNGLKRHPAHVTSYVDGLAASAASFIAMAGDEVVIERHAQMMIHDAAGVCLGNATEMRKLADLLDRLSNTIADMYAQRAGGTVDEWRALMRAETWFDANEAVEFALADRVNGAEDDAEPTDHFDLSGFQFRYAGREAAPAPALVAAADGGSGGNANEPTSGEPTSGDDDFAALVGALSSEPTDDPFAALRSSL